MQKTKKLFPENFMIINGKVYFRLEDGRIAVNDVKNVTIDLEDKMAIKLITVEGKDITANFWKTKDRVYALSSSSYVEMPKEAIFEEVYSLSGYESVMYAKYSVIGNYGILYVTEEEVKEIISHNNNYTQIHFAGDEGAFYAMYKVGDKEYCDVIDLAGEVLYSYPAKRNNEENNEKNNEDKK